MIDPKGEIGFPAREGHVLAKPHTAGHAGKHDRLQIFFLPFNAEQKRRFLAVANRAAERAFVNAALFRRPHRRESIPGVQVIIAKNEVEFAVIFRRTGFGDDFDAPRPGRANSAEKDSG